MGEPTVRTLIQSTSTGIHSMCSRTAHFFRFWVGSRLRGTKEPEVRKSKSCWSFNFSSAQSSPVLTGITKKSIPTDGSGYDTLLGKSIEQKTSQDYSFDKSSLNTRDTVMSDSDEPTFDSFASDSAISESFGRIKGLDKAVNREMLESKLQQHTNQYEALQLQTKNIEKTVETIQERLISTRKLNDSLNFKNTSTRHQLKKMLNQLNAELNHELEIRKLRNEANRLNCHINELEESLEQHTRSLTRMDQEKLSKEVTRDEYQSQLISLNIKHGLMQDLHAQLVINKDFDQILQCQKKLHRLDHRMRDELDKQDKLQQQLSNLTAQEERLLKDNKRLQHENKTLQLQIIKLSSKLPEMVESSARTQNKRRLLSIQKMKRIQQQVDELLSEALMLGERRDYLMRENKRVLVQVKEREKELAIVDIDLDISGQELDEVRQKIKDLETNSKSQIRQLMSKVKVLKREKKYLQKELSGNDRSTTMTSISRNLSGAKRSVSKKSK